MSTPPAPLPRPRLPRLRAVVRRGFRALRRTVRALALRAGLDRLRPAPRCPACGTRPGRPLCGRCRAALRRRGTAARPERLATPPSGSADLELLTLGPYEGALRRTVLAFKRGAGGAGPVAAAALADGAARAGWLRGAQRPRRICWVPSPGRRTWERPYPPARRLARELSRATGVPCAPLLRVSGAPRRQARLGRAERFRNAADAFAARGVAGGHLVLVDDVVTTGATALACAAALRRAGAASVRVVALARTPGAGVSARR